MIGKIGSHTPTNTENMPVCPTLITSGIEINCSKNTAMDGGGEMVGGTAVTNCQ